MGRSKSILKTFGSEAYSGQALKIKESHNTISLKGGK